MANWATGSFLAATVVALSTCPAAQAQDLSAGALEVLYELAAPQALEKMGPGVAHPEVRRALQALRDDKLIPAQRLATSSPGGLLALYGKALLMGARPVVFAEEIALVRTTHLSGNSEARDRAIDALYAKAGRPKPDTAVRATLIRQLDEAARQESAKPLHYVGKKGDRTVEVKRTPEFGTVSVDVVQPGTDGKPVRTVLRGQEATRRTADGKDLEAVVKPDGVCVVVDGDAAFRARLNGVWRSSGKGHEWKVSGEGDVVEMIERKASGHEMIYRGTYKLGRVQAYHPFAAIEDMEDDLPAPVRAELVGMSPKYGFTVRLDACALGADLKGTWASQLVTYSKEWLTISKVHDPFDVVLLLKRDQKVAQGGRFPEDGP